MWVSIFFILRFLFYTYVPSNQLSLGETDDLIKQIDLMFITAGAVMAMTTPVKKNSISRIKVILLSSPIVLIVPLVLLTYMLKQNPDINTDNWYFIAELVFLLYTTVFSFTLPFDFLRSGRKKLELKIFLLSAFALSVTVIYFNYNSPLINALHAFPFLWAAIRFTPHEKI